MFRLDLALGLRQKSSDDDWGRNGQSGGSPLLLLAETNGESEKNPPFPRKLEAELRFRLLSGSVLASLSPNMNHSPGQPSCKTLRVGNKWPDATEPDKSLGGHPLRRPLLRKQGRALGSPHHGVPWAGQSASGGVVTCVTHGRGGAEAEPDAGTGGCTPGRMRTVPTGGTPGSVPLAAAKVEGDGCCQLFSRRIPARSHPAKVAKVFRPERYQRRNPSSTGNREGPLRAGLSLPVGSSPVSLGHWHRHS